MAYKISKTIRKIARKKAREREFCERLDDMLKDEYKAPKDYAKLKSATTDKSIKKKISHITSQERKHYAILKKIRKKCK